MTDEQFVYNQDIRERKSMRTGAFHKKNGSKSKKCSMPSDYLSRKERQKMNSECVSINMSQPITNFAAFKEYPVNMQQEYLQNLVDKYCARKGDICTMFGVCYATFDKHIKENGIVLRFANAKKRFPDDKFIKFIHPPKESKPTKTDEEILKEHFGIDISPKEEKKELEPKVKQEENNPRWIPPQPYIEKETVLESVANSAVNDATYAKAFYDGLIKYGFSEDFAKSLTFERVKNNKFLW